MGYLERRREITAWVNPANGYFEAAAPPEGARTFTTTVDHLQRHNTQVSRRLLWSAAFNRGTPRTDGKASVGTRRLAP